MGPFAARLKAASNPSPGSRRWFFVPYDQLNSSLGPLSRTPPSEAGVVLVESPWKASLRPYHQQKLATVLTHVRHFALEQAARGVAVKHVVSPGDYAAGLRTVLPHTGPLTVMQPAERELREDLAPLVKHGALTVVPHEGWLTMQADFDACGGPPWRMDAFYRGVRQRLGILMDHGKPLGGRYSLDGENRERWPGTPEPPADPVFTVDDVTAEVGDLIRTHFAKHPGTLRLADLPATAADAAALWAWALRHCLPLFGPYEDAMSVRSRALFHTRISALLNLHRILPSTVVADVAGHAALPLSSQEGFIRQVLGWREFVHHVHVATDGFRSLRGVPVPTAASPGDGGYGTWKGSAWPSHKGADGGAQPQALEAGVPLPPAFWGVKSGLNCLDHVVGEVWDHGYSHHITRLMVLSNIGTLLGVSPRELTDWFWVAYTDAYDWVVEPNVLGMGTFATGDVMTTKPYVSGAGYVSRMGDYCSDCAWNPKKNCPLTPMYWHFLTRNAASLGRNPRMMVPVKAASKRTPQQKAEDARVHGAVVDALSRGRAYQP